MEPAPQIASQVHNPAPASGLEPFLVQLRFLPKIKNYYFEA